MPDEVRTHRLAQPQSVKDELLMAAVVCDRNLAEPYGTPFYFTDTAARRVRPADEYHFREGFPLAGIYQGTDPIVAGEPFWVVYFGPASSERLSAQAALQAPLEAKP